MSHKPSEVACIQPMLDEPQNMVSGPWSLSKITLRCGKELMVNAGPDDFGVEP